EMREQVLVASRAVAEPRGRVDRIAEARVAADGPQVQAFEAESDQPQSRVDQRAEQAERGESEPVRRHGHAERARVERRPEVVGLAFHDAGDWAIARNAGGTKLRSVASRIA